MTTNIPRTQAVLDGPHLKVRMIKLAKVLEMELSAQTDLAVYWKDKALKYREQLKDLALEALALDNSSD